MPPKKAGGKAAKKRNDDDEALLAAAMETAKVAQKEQSAKQAEEQAKKAAEAKAAKEAAKAAAEAAARMPPIDIGVAAAKLSEMAHKFPNQHDMRDMCWVTYILHNVLSYAVETGRKIVVTPKEGANPEPVIGFEVRDDTQPGDIHSWNVITTRAGVYALDLALEQFLPSGRHGYKRDALPQEGWVPVKAQSRITQSGSDAVHLGLVAIDKGIMAQPRVEVKPGFLKPGSYQAHVTFMKAAIRGNTRNMNKDEQATAQAVRSKEQQGSIGSHWLEMQENLRAFCWEEPAAAATA